MLENAIFQVLLQAAFVLCRLFRKGDETLEISNCDGAAEGTSSGAAAANSSHQDNEWDPLTTLKSPPPSKKDQRVANEDESKTLEARKEQFAQDSRVFQATPQDEDQHLLDESMLGSPFPIPPSQMKTVQQSPAATTEPNDDAYITELLDSILNNNGDFSWDFDSQDLADWGDIIGDTPTFMALDEPIEEQVTSS